MHGSLEHLKVEVDLCDSKTLYITMIGSVVSTRINIAGVPSR